MSRIELPRNTRQPIEEKTAARVSRRTLLGAAAGAAAFSIVPRHVLGGPNQTAPSQRLTLAGVGVGGVGFGQLQGCAGAGFQIEALCDVDDRMGQKAYDRWPQARRYRDFREMLQAEGDKIDAVYCGTPDHTHAIVTLAALRQGKHVCCVKPLTRTLEECLAVVEAAEQAGVATQVTASPNTSEMACRTCELVWGGVLGPVRELHTWSDRPLWPQGMVRPDRVDAVPSTLDWDLWLGPAPKRPFVEEWPPGHLALQQVLSGNSPTAVYHPWNFRGWWDFGTGALGDMGCHHVNTPFRALKLTAPTHISASSTRVMKETAPLASVVTYEFPARGEMPPVKVVWYDGGIKPTLPLGWDRPLPGSGTLYVGDEGMLLATNNLVLLPESRTSALEQVPRTLPRRPGTWGEWQEACRGGEKAGCHFAWAGLLTDFVLLGNIAIRTGERLEYDAQARQFVNSQRGNELLSQPYENGWSLKA